MPIDNPAVADSGLPLLLKNFQELVDGYGRGIQALVPEGESQAIAKHMTAVVRQQAEQASVFVLEAFQRAPAKVRSEAETLLRRQAGVQLATGAAELAPNLAGLPGILGIADIVTLVKKIIQKILELIFKELPGWVRGLFELIDELIGALGGLFSKSAQREISQSEVDYLRAAYHLRKLELLDASASNDPEDR